MKLSVIIPTFKRPEYLAKALRGLAAQHRKADQIVLGVREGDSVTQEFLTSVPQPVETASTMKPGVIASMSAAAARANGDVICLLDDDAEPLPDWLHKIEEHFAMEPQLGVLGGRDLLQDHPELRRQESLLLRVGVFTWYGRILGNHHRGGGACRTVDLVKGCNAAVRGILLREVGFIQDLRGKGAQVHWELALCLDAANRGFTVGYDPDLQVIHHIAPRHDEDQIHRGIFSSEGLRDMVWNEHHVVGTRAGTWRKGTHLAWALLVGSLTAPGLLQFLRLLARRDRDAREKLTATFQAAFAGRMGC
jgi:GT2 family glycosyltransferase